MDNTTIKTAEEVSKLALRVSELEMVSKGTLEASEQIVGAMEELAKIVEKLGTDLHIVAKATALLVKEGEGR